MTDSKENLKKQESTSECSSEDKTKESKEPTKKKGRLKFKEEDMITIKYNF